MYVRCVRGQRVVLGEREVVVGVRTGVCAVSV